MKIEAILEKIEKIEEGTYSVDQLKEELKEAIRKETCYKITKKSRVNAINRLFKKTTGKSYHQVKQTAGDRFMFTDSYKMYLLNEDLGYPETEQPIENILKFFDTNNYNEEQKIPVQFDFNDIMATYKLKTEFYSINGILFNTKYLKDTIDIIETNAQGFTIDDGKRLYIQNEDDEKALLLGVNIY